MHRSFHFTARDGVRLAGREYGARSLPRVPAVCLAGLTRNGADFDVLATALATHPRHPRRVVTLDMRGRGGSERDPNGTYDLLTEAQDALDGMLAAGVVDANMIGTSRGGLIIMAMGAMRPGIIHTATLNDIGPVIEGDGLMRIRGYLAAPTPKDWPGAVRTLKQTQGKAFPALDDQGWERFARAVYREEKGKLVPAHDPAIHRTLDAVAEGADPPPMWAAFDGLRNVPVLSIRGELSTLFSAKTQDAMRERHPRCRTITVPGEGHAPRLEDASTIEAIAEFLYAAD